MSKDWWLGLITGAGASLAGAWIGYRRHMRAMRRGVAELIDQVARNRHPVWSRPDADRCSGGPYG